MRRRPKGLAPIPPLGPDVKAEVLDAVRRMVAGERDVVIVWTEWLGQLGLLDEINREHGDKIHVAYQKRKAIVYKPGMIEGKVEESKP